MGDFLRRQPESLTCRESRRAGKFGFTEHFCVVLRIPERSVFVFGVHFDKQLFGTERIGKAFRPFGRSLLCLLADVVSNDGAQEVLLRLLPRVPFRNLPF